MQTNSTVDQLNKAEKAANVIIQAALEEKKKVVQKAKESGVHEIEKYSKNDDQVELEQKTQVEVQAIYDSYEQNKQKAIELLTHSVTEVYVEIPKVIKGIVPDEETFGEIIPQKEQWKKDALLSLEEYEAMYKDSIENNEEFWRKQGERISWFKPYTKIKDCRYGSKDTQIKWYYDGQLNACYNCVDRHLEKNGDDIAIIWQGNEDSDSQKITYKELHKNVCRLANGLKALGIKKGDTVTIYMPQIPEIAYAMLACARIGAVHSVIFGGFSAQSVSGRLDNCNSEYIITADAGVRGNKAIPLKKTIDESILLCEKVKVKKTIVVKTQKEDYPFNSNIDIYYSDVIKDQPDTCECEVMDAEDPLFILYTSGSTGAPKGILHTTGGYIVYASLTHKYVFNYQQGQVYWCTADCGWITGHSYVIYGPLSNGATTLMYEGIPNYPDFGRMWQIVDKWNVNIFYTAPTAIRALMKEGDSFVTKYNRKSLKVLATVGEPINPKAWKWYYDVCGNQESPVIDTWWQTETGGIMITPLVGTIDLKPGFASKPFFGINPGVMDENGKELAGPGKGSLVIKQSWPGQMRSVYGNHQRFLATYFSQYDGYYFPSDGCVRDEHNYYRITGRIDDVILVSGHNLGTAELESGFVSHEAVAEAAVVGYPHDVKGSGLYAFCILQEGFKPSEDLEKALVQQLRKKIGPIATPDYIQFVAGLPKTRSGKIMRRILRKIVEGAIEELGDITTLADHAVIEDIIKNRKNIITISTQ